MYALAPLIRAWFPFGCGLSVLCL